MELARRMERYVAGDEGAFPLLYRRLEPRVRGQIIACIGRHPAVDDLVQITFMLAHRARDRWVTPVVDPDRGVFAWYAAIARNAAITHLRHSGRRPSVVVHDGEAGLVKEPSRWGEPERAMLRREYERVRREILRDGIARLSSRQREVIELHRFAGLTMDTIARRLGIRAGAVRVRAHRAYQRLRELANESEAARRGR